MLHNILLLSIMHIIAYGNDSIGEFSERASCFVFIKLCTESIYEMSQVLKQNCPIFEYSALEYTHK